MKRPADDSPELAHISPDLRALAVHVDTLFNDPDNVRLHPERNMQAVASSLAKFGQRKPIVVNERNMSVEAGNGTLEAARVLGWKWIAISREDDDTLTAAGYAIADNRTAELATWNYQGLSDQLHSLIEEDFDIGLLGYNEDELDALGEETVAEGQGSEGDGKDPGEPTCQIRIHGVLPAERDEFVEDLDRALAEFGLTAKAY